MFFTSSHQQVQPLFFSFLSLASAPESKRLDNIALQVNTMQFSYTQELLLCAYTSVENTYSPVSKGDL